MAEARLTLKDLEALKIHLTEDEYLTLLYKNYPSLWIEEYIPDPVSLDKNCKLRDYQVKIVNGSSKKKILRLGRQLGKSFTIQALILYYGCTMPNAKILVIGPQKIHVENIFDEILNLSTASDYLKSQIKGSTKQPRRINFINGAVVKGFTTGEDSGGKGLSIRGQTANIIFIDEADYINDEVMANVVMPTQNSFKDPITFLSSTPTGRRSYYRNQWDSGFYQTFHVPSNKSPAWSKEKEAEIRAGTTRLGYLHEYDAEWGDQEEGVFSKEDLKTAAKLSELVFKDARAAEGIKKQYSYSDEKSVLDDLIKPRKRVLGVDWNKSPNGTRLIWCDFDENHNCYIRGKWKIDTAEFTQNTAMNKIIELHAEIGFDFIMVDVGYGSVQLEDMHLYGLRNPGSRMDKVVKPVATDSTIEITDIATGEKRKTFVKNFIVESSVRFMEQNRIRFPVEENLNEDTKGSKKAKDSKYSLADALSEYVIEKYTSNGRPVYGCNLEDHDIDAFMFTIYGYLTEVIKTQNLWEKMPKAKIRTTSYDKIIKNRFKSESSDDDDDMVNSKQGEKPINPPRMFAETSGYYGTYAESNGGPSRIINRTKIRRSSSRFGVSHTKIIKGGISRRIR
jgi:replicative DNA helicase